MAVPNPPFAARNFWASDQVGIVTKLKTSSARSASFFIRILLNGRQESMIAISSVQRLTIKRRFVAGIHEAETNLGIFVENAVEENARKVHHLAERMAKRVNGCIWAHVIQTHMI